MAGRRRLAEYQAKRDFTKTREPAGDGRGGGTGDLFVVQRHRARRRHYDLRLELDGVLVSWAVPKGPTLDPDVRRMAVHVEDHPLEYAGFEGVIPAGEYGGGDVIVWDHGTWEPAETDDPAQAIADGNLHFDLHGEKLVGRFVLVRKGRGDSADKEQWLLLHKHDDHASKGWDAEDYPKSVQSGRTNDEVAAAPEATWHSDRPAAEAEVRIWQAPTPDELAELDALGAKGTWTLGGRKLSLTNLDKVLFGKTRDFPAITKRELIAYYATIAPVMLPYLADRPLNTHRFPDGIAKPGFWQKEAPGHAPKWLRRWHYERAAEDETQCYLIPDSPAALAWLANYGALELHAWTSRAPDVDHPTWALFDIDPGPRTEPEDLLLLARLHRTALEHLGLQGRPKVTGQRGIQVWVPIEPRYTYAETRAWAETVSRTIGRAVPELVSWEWNKDKRRGLARLDYTQNVINKTLVAPYSVRPRPGAPVSVPLEWDELDDPGLRPDRWTIHTVADRLRERKDPFSALLGVRQELPRL
ncbi:non-homologous end-joining DNA ligase [Amycolatopsis pithecellobii]|uniref:ATP-dependent DNA ligase n=1 Tax=Amycolatopsis pithecellobii TaxID=664692 RepID=A0A6N7Z1F2_9PSEU|nr:non-homologous end-joining DNA ligase [Amycolatopsis pithecellobii]MTD53364.1 ATP-dependent DNA ligase [Amycolatopsis pithecellobii]